MTTYAIPTPPDPADQAAAQIIAHLKVCANCRALESPELDDPAFLDNPALITMLDHMIASDSHDRPN